MLDPTLLLGFIAASLVVLLVPGPGVAYVVARSISQGYGAGFVSAVGLAVGALVHAVAAAIGLSAILLASATAFTVIKFLGAAYLVYLGLQAIFSRSAPASAKNSKSASQPRLFLDGILISVLNPKVALFFLAYLPQFTNPEFGSLTTQLALLGTIYAFMALLTDGGYALIAGRLRETLARRAQSPELRYVTGGLYLGLGANAALQPVREL